MHNLDQGYRYGFMFMPRHFVNAKEHLCPFSFRRRVPRENLIGKVENNVARKAAPTAAATEAGAVGESENVLASARIVVVVR